MILVVQWSCYRLNSVCSEQTKKRQNVSLSSGERILKKSGRFDTMVRRIMDDSTDGQSSVGAMHSLFMHSSSLLSVGWWPG